MQNLVDTTTSIIPIILSLLIIQSTALESCAPFSCNRHRRDTIQFPFWVPRNQSNRCGYPGFNLSCDGDETLLHLKNSNPFTVRAIDYPDQLIWVTDPNRCLPKRVLELNLTKTPFVSGPLNTEYSFLNCSSAVNNNDSVFVPDGTSVVSCLSERNFTVFLTFEKGSEQKMVNEWKCKVIKRVVAPIWWPDFGYGFIPPDLSNVFLQLSWDIPDCGDCELRGGSCGFVSDSGLSVGCFLPNGNGGLSRSAQVGVILGAGIPGLICMIALTFYISGKVRASSRNQRRANTESSPAIFPQPFTITLGLDRCTIESYPKTVLGESKRLPKPSDGTCPICLSEYQPKETLRSIPECNHYFHAECIDEWLRMNATCPLCRNSPQRSSGAAGL